MRAEWLDLKILGSIFITLVFTIGFGILMVQYSNILKSQTAKFRVLLISLRTSSILILLFLLLNPWFKWQEYSDRQQKIAVIYDDSASVQFHLNNSHFSIEDIKAKFEKWGQENDLAIEHYSLGEEIIPYWDDNTQSPLTDFGELPEFITFRNPDQLILMSDGVATTGKEIQELEIPSNYPIHTLGVGPLKTGDDIELLSIDYPLLILDSDTVDLKILLKSQLSDETTAIVQIKNENGKVVFNSSIMLSKESSSREITALVPAVHLKGLNRVEIINTFPDFIPENNSLDFRIDAKSSKEGIFLITGALSPNTSLLKTILKNLPRAEVDHRYRLNNMRWNKDGLQLPANKPKIIVMDNFPAENKDRGIFIKLANYSRDNGIPLIYFEGPNIDLKTAEIIHSQFPEFHPWVIESNVSVQINSDSPFLNISGAISIELPPQHRSVKWVTDFTPLHRYQDGSLMMGSHELFHLISLPEFSQTHLKSLINESTVHKLINYFIKKIFLGKEGLLTLNIKGIHFNLGEKINTSVKIAENMALAQIQFMAVYEGKDTSYFQGILTPIDDYYTTQLSFKKPGEYAIYAKARQADGSWLYSEENILNIKGIHIEFKELVQDRNALMGLAQKTLGTYLPIESLDSLFSLIDITPVHLVQNHHISGISTQYFWWLIILLLTIEWYFRKKLGLL